MHRSLRDVYGPDYAERQSEAAALKQAVDDIFATRTRRTAVKRYCVVMSLRESTVRQTPGAAVVFDFLERHWPTLVNGIESDLIPTTNNAVELVIRRFDQHYQNFCGFESLETAHVFLGVFENVYRFTPFTEDAQPRVRGKSPLELAGYDVANLPMAAVCRGWALAPSTEPVGGVVPNV